MNKGYWLLVHIGLPAHVSHFKERLFIFTCGEAFWLGLGFWLGWDSIELQENEWTDRSQSLSGCVTYHLEYNGVKLLFIKKIYIKKFILF